MPAPLAAEEGLGKEHEEDLVMAALPEPELARPPGWEDYVPELAPPTLLPEYCAATTDELVRSPEAQNDRSEEPDLTMDPLPAPELTRPPGWEEFVTEPAPSSPPPPSPPPLVSEYCATMKDQLAHGPGAQNVSSEEQPDLMMDASLESELTRPPGWEDFITEPAPSSPPPSLGYVGIEKSRSSSPNNFSPPDYENTSSQPRSLSSPRNLENVNFNSPETSTAVDPGSLYVLKTSSSSPQTFTATDGGARPNILPSPVNNEKNMSRSPETTVLPGRKNTASPVAPVAPLPQGSVSTERSIGSSRETTSPPRWENVVSQRNPSATPDREIVESTPILPPSCDRENVCSQPVPAAPRASKNVGTGPMSDPPPPPEVGQMVCGSCRQLLSYPRGILHIKCPCCQIVNFVLEEHQVGNVKCGKCCMLLMYPFGAPAVRCSSCRFVTEIGAHNARPPLSVQQGRSPLPQNLIT